MPTVILLDNSLSMYKPDSQNWSQKDAAETLIRGILNTFAKRESIEHVSLVTLSSNSKIMCPFTKDYDSIVESIKQLKPGDDSILEQGLNLVSDLVIEEYGCFIVIDIILITNDVESIQYDQTVESLYKKLSVNQQILKDFHQANGICYEERRSVSIIDQEMVNTSHQASLTSEYFHCKYPFSFPNRFHVVCYRDTEQKTSQSGWSRLIYDEEDLVFKRTAANTSSNKPKVLFLNELLNLNNTSGKFYSASSSDTKCLENDLVKSLTNNSASLFQLRFGNLESSVILYPPPISFRNNKSIREINKTLEIITFVNTYDFTLPPTISRHLIITKQEDQASSETKSFTTLLHVGLKSESVVGVTKLSEDWFGVVHCWNEATESGGKRSNLMLTVFEPGTDFMINLVTKLVDANQSNGASNDVKNSLKSYSKQYSIWYRANNLSSDLLKIMRNAKKMQDKMPIFYKELNRVRKAALSYGFYELFDCVSDLLKKELATAGNSFSQEAKIQISHAINCLNSNEYKEYRKDIQPWVQPSPAPAPAAPIAAPTHYGRRQNR